MIMTINTQTMLVWSGVSALDNVTPLVVLASFESSNVKTGNMVQLAIVVDGVKPTDAIATGADSAICGKCIHKGDKPNGVKRTCYVPMRAVNSTYGAYTRGNTRPLDLDAFKGRRVRIGTYGDPAAVPFEVWAEIEAVSDGVTGYTHQWKTCDPRFATLCMASADNMDEYLQARRKGYRSFVVRELGDAKPKGLVQCPATEGKDNTVTCLSCMQCGGTGNGRTNSISIEVHGSGKGSFKALPLAVV